jgi:tetratricopeptide (TPR) repeat protein
LKLEKKMMNVVAENPSLRTGWLMFQILLALCLVSALRAQTSTADILQVKFYYDAFEFDNAIAAGNELLKTRGQLASEELEFLHQYLALSFYNTGQLDSARAHFLSLLSINPKLELDPVTVSPKIIDFFNDIRKDYQELSGSTGQTFHTQYIFVEDLRPGAAWRSAILPGWGQFYKKQKTKGYILGGAFWSSLIATGIAWLNEDRAHQDYLASTSPEDIESNYSTYNKWYKTRRTLTVTTGMLWVVTVGDALWSPYAKSSLALTANGDVTLAIQFRLK